MPRVVTMPDGRRYLVRSGRVVDGELILTCWGDVQRATTKRTYHGPCFDVKATDVQVQELPHISIELSNELVRQGVKTLRSRGEDVWRTRKGNWMRGGQRVGWTRPRVRNGGESPLPEKREDVRARMLERLTTPGAAAAIRQDFSNGEFTVSSLIIGESFEAVANRGLDLEVPGDEAFHDTELGVWWRRGGSFD